jgi:hypothetical protein
MRRALILTFFSLYPALADVEVRDSSGAVWIEIRINPAIPVQPVPADSRGTDFPQLRPSTLLGVIRYHKAGQDFCGQPIPPATYTMRYALLPEDGAHLGVAARRDFVLLSPLAIDPDPAAHPTYEALVQMSRQASGTNHPAVLSLSSPPAGTCFPALRLEPHRQTLQFKSGSLELGIVLVGKAAE